MTAKKSKLEKIYLDGFPNSYLFDESVNPYGTIKDRRSHFILAEATRLHVDKLVLITAGNGGYSLSKLAENMGIKVVCVISRTLNPDIKRALGEHAYQVIELNLDQKILRPEELITISRESDDEVIWDVTNGYEESYADIVHELTGIVSPDYIVCPVGSGGIFIGLVEGVKKFSPHTKVIGIGTREVHTSFADKLFTPWSPYTRAMENLSIEGHQIYRITEEHIRKTYQHYKHYGDFEASSAIVFAALDVFPFKPSDKIVFVNTGRLRV